MHIDDIAFAGQACSGEGNEVDGVGEQTLGSRVKADKDRLRSEGESTRSLGEGERAELAWLKRGNFELRQDKLLPRRFESRAAFFASKPRKKSSSN